MMASKGMFAKADPATLNQFWDDLGVLLRVHLTGYKFSDDLANGSTPSSRLLFEPLPEVVIEVDISRVFLYHAYSIVFL